MLRRHAVLAVAGFALPTLLAAGDLPIVELGSPSSRVELAAAPIAAAPAGILSGVLASPPKPIARLVWLDPTSSAFGTEAVARPEVVRLLGAMGVEATWRRGEPQDLARPGELRVIFLERATQRGPDAPVLGATPASFLGEPFVWIHVPSVRAAAGVGQRSGPTLDIYSAHRLGTALGRVIAHEVVHVLAPSLPHGSGLMSARLSQAMLTGAKIRIDPEVGLAVRAALVAAAPARRPGSEILAAKSGPGEELDR